MLRVHAFVHTLGRCGFDDAVNQFLQGVVLVGHRDLVVGCGDLLYESTRVIDDKNYDRIIKTTNKNIIVKKKGDLTIGDIDPFEK